MSCLRVTIVAIVFLLASVAKPACVAPATPQILQYPTSTISVGQSYAIIWSRTAGDDGAYVVERSTSPSFGAMIETQFAGGVAASFIALQSGTYYHRVRAVPACSTALQSAPSSAVPVIVSPTGNRALTTDGHTSPFSEVNGLLPPAPAGESMLIIPQVARAPGAGGTFYFSKLRINNASNFETKLDLVFVSMNSDPSTGAPAVDLTIQPNDAVSVEDVIGVLFPSFISSYVGSLEIRAPDRSPDVLTVSAPVIRRNLNGSTSAEYVLPVLRRGEGARVGLPHRVSGAVSTGTSATSIGIRTNMIFVETTRSPSTTPTMFQVKLLDGDGTMLGTTAAIALPPGGMTQLSGLSQVFGVGTVEDGVLETFILSGNGSVVTIASQIDNATNEQAGCFVSEPIGLSGGSRNSAAAVASTKLYAVVGAVQGRPAESQLAYRTRVGITAGAAEALVTMTLLSERALAAPRVTRTIPANSTVEFADALADLFHLSTDVAARGTIVIETLADIQVYGSLFSPDRPDTPVAGNLPVVQVLSEALVSATTGMQRPIYFSGLEQLVDPSKGGRWRVELTELAGGPSVVTVYLYEAANRTTPLATRDFALYPRQHLVLDTVFKAMGLEETLPTTDRRDVQVVVYPKSGRGRVAATATGSYAATGRESKYILTPNGGIPATGASLAAPLLPPVDDRRRHAVRK